MAKKRGGNNKQQSNASSVETMPRASDDAAAEPVAVAQDVDSMSVDELRRELLAARAELATLRAQTSTAGKLAVPQEVQQLQAKLQQLRADQQEADAAREKAWSQLKAVVTEISSLAKPDYLQSLVVSKPQE